jgi:hypothetical protein
MAVHANDPDDAIPMNKTKPTTILFAVGASVLVIAAIAFTFMGGKKKKEPDAAQPGAAAPTSTMTPEEQKRHLEITRKSLEAFAAVEAEKKKKEAETKAAEEAKAAPPAAGPAPGGGSPPPGGGAPPPAGGGGDAPKPVKKVSKKEASDLDGLKDIATQLGK